MVLNLSSLCLLFKFFQNFLVCFFLWSFSVFLITAPSATKLRIEETLFRISTFTGHCLDIRFDPPKSVHEQRTGQELTETPPQQFGDQTIWP